MPVCTTKYSTPKAEQIKVCITVCQCINIPLLSLNFLQVQKLKTFSKHFNSYARHMTKYWIYGIKLTKCHKNRNNATLKQHKLSHWNDTQPWATFSTEHPHLVETGHKVLTATTYNQSILTIWIHQLHTACTNEAMPCRLPQNHRR